jgi:membrane associated rhomboid family serine protease
MNQTKTPFGSGIESFLLSFLLIALVWILYGMELLLGESSYDYGVIPGNFQKWHTVFSMSFVHDLKGLGHIVSNTVPSFLLFVAIMYYYRFAAFSLLLVALFFPPLAILLLGQGTSPHVGFSGAVYTFFGFVLLSGFLRNYLPLQVLSLLVVFIYGSMIWGVFPQKTNVSWEGHFSGFFVGICFAWFYRNKGPKRPKLRFEIEKELGIEPPDLEGQWREQQALQAQMDEDERIRLMDENEQLFQLYDHQKNQKIVYHYLEKEKNESY